MDRAPHRVDRAARLVAGKEQDVSIDLAAELARIAAAVSPWVYVDEMCAMFGWRDPRHAMVYFNPSPGDIAGRL